MFSSTGRAPLCVPVRDCARRVARLCCFVQDCAGTKRQLSTVSEATMSERGIGMATDIAEQPGVYATLLEPARLGAIAQVAKVIAERRPKHVVFTARGTSDHAALYAAYLTEIRLGLPAGLASPSAITVFGARPDLSNALVVGVSQSGGSP